MPQWVCADRDLVAYIAIKILIACCEAEGVFGEPAAGGRVVPAVEVPLQAGVAVKRATGEGEEEVNSGRRVVAHHARADYQPLHLKAGYAEDLARSSLRKVIASGRPRVINDLPQYLRDHPDSVSTRLIVAEGLHSSMTCPLSVAGRQVGLLFRSSRQAHAYDDHQVRLWQAVAERISQAVEKAYRIEQLDQANRAYMEMLGFVSHELKNPVASMVLDARLLVDGYLGDLTDKQTGKSIAEGHEAELRVLPAERSDLR